MENYKELSFDCVLPSAIFFNQNLEPACIKFYAIVRNLTKMHGYCYATNEYLAETLASAESSVRRWISSLESEGYLEVETEKNGIHWQRRIYISDKFKENLRRLKNEHPPAQNSAPPCSKMSTIIEEYSKEGLIKEVVCPEGAVAPIPGCQKNIEKKKTNGESLKVEKDEIIRSAIQKKMDWSLPEIEEAWEILIKYSGKVNDPWRFIEGTIENLRKKKNLDKLQSKEKKCSPTTQMPPVKALTPEEIALRRQHAQKLFSGYLTNP